MSYYLDPLLQRSILVFESTIKSKATLQTYGQHVKWFLKFTKIKDYDSLLEIPVDQLQTIIEDYVMHLKKTINPNSVPVYMTGVKHFFIVNRIRIYWEIIQKFYPEKVKRGGQKPFHNFRPTESGVMKACLPVFLYSTDKVYLTWNDWVASGQDYDLHLMSSDMTTELDISFLPQTGTQYPTEAIDVDNNNNPQGNYCVAVSQFNGNGPMFLRIYLIGLGAILDNNERSLGSINTPADGLNTLAVGAVDKADDSLEDFTARGPTDDGRNKPEICAPNRTYSHQFQGPFQGTSASAPHVGGLAALYLEESPTMSLSDLRQKIIDTSISIADSGNNKCGGGLAQYQITSGSCVFREQNGKLIISQSCTMALEDIVVDKSVLVDSNSILTIPNGAKLDIDFENENITIKSGSAVLIKDGGTLT